MPITTTNTILTPQLVAREAVMVLTEEMLLPELVNRDYENEWFDGIGNTINARIPATFEAKEFVDEIEIQNINEGYVPIVLNKLADVSMKVTAAELAYDIDRISERIILPAVRAIVKKVSRDVGTEIYTKAAHSVTTTDVATTKLGDIGKLGKIFDTAAVPMYDRKLVLSPDHKYKYALTDNLSKVAYAGDNRTLRDAILGRIYGFDTYMDQGVRMSEAVGVGTFSGALSVASGTTGTVTITGTGGAALQMLKGEGFLYNGVIYRLNADTSFVSGVMTNAAVSPAFPAGVTATTVEIVRGASSLAFHRDAITLAIRPLKTGFGIVEASTEIYKDVAIRFVQSYDIVKKCTIWSFDVLYGVKMLVPNAAARLYDTTVVQ